MSDPPTFTLGTAVDEAFAASTMDWCSKNRGMLTKEEAFSLILNHVLVQTLYTIGGRVNVTITIGGRRFNDADVYFFRFQRAANSRLTFTGGTLDL